MPPLPPSRWVNTNSLAESADASAGSSDQHFSPGNFIGNVHHACEDIRNFPHSQGTTSLSRGLENLRILPGMPPVSREQVVDFVYACMRELGVSSSELARRARVNESTINKFLAKTSRSDLSMKTISKLSDISGLPFPVLSNIVHTPVAKEGQPRGAVDLKSTIPVQGGSARDLPIYGEDRIGYMSYAFVDPAPLGLVERPAYLTNTNAYALRIKDNSMAPRFKAGELVYVDPNRPAVANDEVVIRLKSGEGWVRRLIARGIEGIRTDTYESPGVIEPFPNDELDRIDVIVGVAISL